MPPFLNAPYLKIRFLIPNAFSFFWLLKFILVQFANSFEWLHTIQIFKILIQNGMFTIEDEFLPEGDYSLNSEHRNYII